MYAHMLTLKCVPWTSSAGAPGLIGIYSACSTPSACYCWILTGVLLLCACRQLAKMQEIRNRERESIATPGSRPATTPGTSAARKRVLGL